MIHRIRIARRLSNCLIALGALLSAVGFGSAAESPLSPGLWAGGHGDPAPEAGHWSSLFLRIDSSNETSFRGAVPLENGASFQGTIADGRVRFEVEFGGRKIAFDGTSDGATLRGSCTVGGRREQCILVREGAHDSAELAAAAGMFAVDRDHRILLTKSFHLVFEDLKTGEQRVLYGAGEDRFTAGPSIGIPRPVEWTLILERDDARRVTGFRIERPGSDRPTVARRCCEVQTEEFSFAAPDGIEIRGTLYLPAGRTGKLPGVVWVHGSGRQDRFGAGNWPWFFTDLGFAFLAVDKRGVGASAGKYALPGGGHDNRPHMLRRSKDVRAAIDALAAHDRVRGERIGLAGASQAGWVIPMAAADNPRVGFSVILSGGATNLSYEGIFSDLADEDGSGVDGSSIAQVLAETRKHKPTDPDFREFFRSMHGPGLWIYGGKDRSNPSKMCIELLEEIRDQADKDFTMKFFPEANHGLMQARYGGAAEFGTLQRRVPGLYAAVSEWLKAKELLP